MNKISIAKSCRRCERSSTYIKKKIKGGEYYVCSSCGAKLCKASEIMDYAFPKEEKPMSGIARQHLGNNKKKKKSYRRDDDY